MSRPDPSPHAPRRRTLPRLSVSARVWCLAAVLGAMGLGLFVFRVGRLSTLDTAVVVPFFVLAGLFAATEVFVVHLQFRRDAHSFSLSEIPLLIGLAFTGPVGFVVARVLGAVAALVLHRRQSGVKLAFNVGHFFLEACLAVTVYRAVLGDHDPAEPWGWVAAFSATVLTDLVSALTITSAISLYDRRVDRRMVVQVLLGGVIAAVTNTSLALLAVIVLGVNVAAVWLLVVVAVILFLAYRAYSSLIQSYSRTELLYGFTRAVGRSVQAESVMHAMLTQARDLLRAEIAEITLFGAGDQPPLRITLEGDDLQQATALRALDGPDGAGSWWQAVVAGDATLVPRAARNDRRLPFGEHDLKDAMAVPLRGDSGVEGMMIVANRLGEVSTFDSDDLRLFETLANHASVALENGRLVDRLRHEASEKEHQALHDSLTGLPNRRLFHGRVSEALGQAGPGGPAVAVMLMDLDRFKEINDTLGHEVGDLVLRDVGARLKRKLRGRGTIARLGGDEFAILLPDVITADEAMEEAHELLRALDAPFKTQELSIDVDASIGLALSPMHGHEAASLLQHADVAMYTAKQRHGGVEVYEPESDQHSRRRLALAGELRVAVEEGHLELHYQPVVRMSDGSVAGAEALVRWHHSTHGWVTPDEFIPLAEHTSLIRPLTLFVLEAAIAQAAAWRKSGRTLSVSVNLSARSLLDLSLPHDIARLLLESGVPADGLTLEITESSIMSDPGRTEAVLDRLHVLGVGLSIDDFGTGYSSLSYLKRLPVDQVKIDKSFVINMAGDENDAAIVRSTIDLGHNLGLRVVAEGVEEQDAWDKLLALGCDLAQGYILSRPLPAAAFSEWLAETEGSGLRVLPARNVPTPAGALS